MYPHKQRKSIKVFVLEFIDSFKYIIALAYTSLAGLLIYNLIQPSVLKIVVAIILTVYLIIFLKSLPRGFCTTHNMAQLAYGDTLLSKTYLPGDFLFLFPGYRVVEHKDSQLLDTNELSMTIKNDNKDKDKNLEVQFKDGEDSLWAKNISINYYLNKNKIYNFLIIAPREFEASLTGNIMGDIAKAFQKRISNLTESQEFTDLIYIDPKNPHATVTTPSYAKEAGFYIYIDQAKGEKWPSFITDKKGKNPDTTLLYLPELNSTLERARSYGIYLTKIDIEGFKDSEKTEDLRNAIEQQKFINKKKDSATEKRRDLIDQYKKDYIADGFDAKTATLMARQDVLAEEGNRKEYGGDSNANLLINPEKN